ncbi:hypothetical protein PHMEG_00018011 [Phytophthora megakarya]|uniref:Reverse transcriptase n=1 Tax=Phytophthora megakarya TaxID=4795 RepID=A0A225VVD1_9STRA|nr:hypothetical protein PHMEG_00018011 [Phytophthora megakarya]
MFYHILMGEEDVPLPAVSTPSGMQWEWLNAPVTFNRIMSNLLHLHRQFAPTYFDGIVIHS